MNILVTGGTGFLGRCVVGRLLAAGVSVRALARPGRTLPAGVETVTGDLRSRADVDRAVCGVDAVVHAGARVTTTGAWSEFQAVNVEATKEIIDAAGRHGVERVVHVSSLSVYAVERDGACITEDSPLEERAHERGYYTLSKLQADRLCGRAIQDGAPVTVVRPGILYGPGRRPPLGRKSLALGRVRLVLGSRGYLLPLVFVDNAAAAVCQALRLPRARGRVYTVVDPQIPLQDYLDLYRAAAAARWRAYFVPAAAVLPAALAITALMRAMGRRSPLSPHQLRRATRNALYDCRRAATELKWAPDVSLVAGLQRALQEEKASRDCPDSTAASGHETD